MNQTKHSAADAVAEVVNPSGTSDIVLVCEHASAYIPPALKDLGLSGPALTSHAAWDPGAAAVARDMAHKLDAPLVMSRVSRLVYDCNRPPAAPDAMPARSEIYDIPGNTALSDPEKSDRAATYYEPFRTLLRDTLSTRIDPVVVTIHSFTPVYKGIRRDVEIGILHDCDSRLADAMLAQTSDHTSHVIRRNAPYGPTDGVTHTLKEHAIAQGRRNVMIEVRNDLIATAAAQAAMARLLANWVSGAVACTAGEACKG